MYLFNVHTIIYNDGKGGDPEQQTILKEFPGALGVHSKETNNSQKQGCIVKSTTWTQYGHYINRKH
jgi:hypothetical protein